MSEKITDSCRSLRKPLYIEHHEMKVDDLAFDLGNIQNIKLCLYFPVIWELSEYLQEQFLVDIVRIHDPKATIWPEGFEPPAPGR